METTYKESRKLVRFTSATKPMCNAAFSPAINTTSQPVNVSRMVSQVVLDW